MKAIDLQIQNQIHPVRPERVLKPVETPGKSQQSNTKDEVKSFSKVLDEKIAENRNLKFSTHAMQRLDKRQINLSPAKLSRLEGGVRNVEEKGGRSSLILLDDVAYIVSIKNRTVITALTKEATQNNVFTNVDSVAIV